MKELGNLEITIALQARSQVVEFDIFVIKALSSKVTILQTKTIKNLKEKLIKLAALLLLWRYVK